MKHLINFRTNSKNPFINNNGETFNQSQLSHHCCSNSKKTTNDFYSTILWNTF